jgi:hypothetical protein
MSDTRTEASTSTSSSSDHASEMLDGTELSQANAVAEEAFILEEAALEHYHFLVKYTSKMMEVRLTVEDTVTELKAVSCRAQLHRRD